MTRHPVFPAWLSNRLRPIGVAVLWTLLSACSAITVTQDYDPAHDFSTLKTYAWLPDLRTKTSLDDLELGRVQSAVDSGLQARGFSKAEANPDLLVSADTITERQTQVITRRYGYGYWEGYETYNYNVGTLILDFVDPNTERLVWRGEAQAVLSEDPTSEERSKRVNEAVTKMLERFPPKQDRPRSGDG
ncbi:MAG: DUF4136 domain-containing protein [Chromatiales bacterium]|jgi:hypothetical protein